MGMDKNKISIIIPVYNAEDYLERCIQSILSQNFSSYEVILVDDGSSDASSLICDRYSATDPRFRTIHKPNGGVSSARNAGIDLAKGEYLMFVDSDDALMTGALKTMTDGLEGEDMILGGYVSYIDSVPKKEQNPRAAKRYEGGQMNEFFNRNIKKNCEMLDAPWAKLFRRKAVGSLRFNEKLSYAEDKLFVFSFLASCSSVRTCPSMVYAYHLRSGSLGSDVASDRHLMQLRRFLPAYSVVLSQLSLKYPDCRSISGLYHNDIVGRYICRILNIFLTRRTSLLTEEFLSELYSMMEKDKGLGVLSLRKGQILNLMIFKYMSVRRAVKTYKFAAGLSTLFRRR